LGPLWIVSYNSLKGKNFFDVLEFFEKLKELIGNEKFFSDVERRHAVGLSISRLKKNKNI
jgi:hypothetical protein